MPMTDPLGDMLTRIRNGQQARKDSILTPASKLRANVLDVLQREGYIRGYTEEELAGQKGLRIELKYFEGQPAIQHLARVSKPGRRVYSASRELPRIRNGLGIPQPHHPTVYCQLCDQSGAKATALQTLARWTGARELREASGVRRVHRRFSPERSGVAHQLQHAPSH